jgi:translation initiation factor 4A
LGLKKQQDNMGHSEEVSERTAGQFSLQVQENMMSKQNKAVPEQELSGKIRCFACNATSHSLDQCSTKYKIVTVAHKFGYATKFPFIMFPPSEDMPEKEKFYHHCLLITSSASNLNLGMLKGELQKLWNLSGNWVLRRKCSKSFLASFSSQDDVVSCLKNPNMETLLDDEEVNLTITRWMEGDDESNGLIEQWFLVCGVPRKYRAWTELYQFASAFGVLIDVDEESLQVGDKEPIRLKLALKNHDGAPFSYHYVVDWCSRMVMLTLVAKLDSENNGHSTRIVTSTGNHVLDFGDSSDKEHGKELNAAQISLLEEPTTCIIEESILDGRTKENETSTSASNVNKSKETTMESSKPEEVQSICQNSTTIIEEDRAKGEHACFFFLEYPNKHI